MTEATISHQNGVPFIIGTVKHGDKRDRQTRGQAWPVARLPDRERRHPAGL